ncbi:NUDIX domain-containing protein [Patescibacteria group bacterium]|nr:NUDIX domain-containing protein [Patescibacteria group bacterium]MCL5091593.1 NUDIX domain-containing protein [Patescibacteria group bacterium]
MKADFDLDEVESSLIQLVKEAGIILRRYFESGGFTQRQKAGVDFTTQADCEVDQFLKDKLAKKYPNSNFLTEESAPADYASLADKGNLWVIDPLDGTINFSRKHSNFAISIALMDHGHTRFGVVYLPAENKLYFARSDKDAAYLNGEKISCSSTAALRETVVACDWAWDLDKRKTLVAWLGRLSGHIRQIKSMGSAASDLCSLAAGKIDVYIHSGLKPWDAAAAGLIIKKAGGVVTLPDGSPWSPFQPGILASNKKLHHRIIRLVSPQSTATKVMKSRIVASVIIEKDGKILLGRKKPGTFPYPNCWIIIGGGVRLEKETVEEGLRREVREEANIEIADLKKLEFAEDNEPNKHGEMTHYLFLTYLARYQSGTPTPGDDVNELRWFSKQELKTIKISRPSIIRFKQLGWL